MTAKLEPVMKWRFLTVELRTGTRTVNKGEGVLVGQGVKKHTNRHCSMIETFSVKERLFGKESSEYKTALGY